ncbi:homeobox-leucine zipper protein HOX17-like isoform X2 [Musa acuminata AAA Group]|uniref:homeobox-leucine zipper protein HOX17-like isoform X2 n=1 Tax=Musa acuminata AAA Group TaxID=214697 RepID=UPI0031E38657
MCSSSITLHHFNHLNPTGSYAPPSSPHLTMQEEECNVSLSLAIGGVGDLPFIKNLDQTSFKEEKEEKRDGGGTRKKLRLSGEQLALLEDSFRAHSTLAPDQKQELAQRLHLQPRQVEVWFQNRRARTKLKQTEVDCGFLRRCCERLANENRRLKRELMEMRSVVKPGPQLSIEHRKAARLRMCSSCEKMTSDEKESSLLSTINS